MTSVLPCDAMQSKAQYCSWMSLVSPSVCNIDALWRQMCRPYTCSKKETTKLLAI